MKKDIETIDDIQLMVDTFYERVRHDELLSPIFSERIENRWPEHLEKMYRFWQTILLDVHSYSGTPFAPHADMPVNEIHFTTWVKLFTHTVDELFSGPIANEAKRRGTLMAAIFHSKISFINQHSF
ncbi:MAG: group III truncated hemoglobin [Bacteroidetes bacterium]|nr:group III truncated hemoglobin [Bacteroidota bacterium]